MTGCSDKMRFDDSRVEKYKYVDYLVKFQFKTEVIKLFETTYLLYIILCTK